MENKQKEREKVEQKTAEEDYKEFTNSNPFEDYILEKSEKFFELEKHSGIQN